jgi:hypothetical protein
MLEFLVIMLLASANSRTVALKGRRPLFFILLTVGLWLGFEVIGYIVGREIAGRQIIFIYLTALLCAVIGGVVSNVIARCAKPGPFVGHKNKTVRGAVPLARPIKLKIIPKVNLAGLWAKFRIYLNGQDLGEIKNRQTLETETSFSQNVLVVMNAAGLEQRPIFFQVKPGEEAAIAFDRNWIVPELGDNIVILNECALMSVDQNEDSPDPSDDFGQLPETVSMDKSETEHQTEYLKPQIIPSLPEKPARTIWIIGSALGLMLLSFILISTGIDKSPVPYIVNIYSSLIMVSCVYLVQKSDKRYKYSTIVIMALTAVMSALFISYYHLTMIRTSLPFIEFIKSPEIIHAIKGELIFVLVVGILSFGLPMILKSDGRKRFLNTAWIIAGVLFIWSLYSILNFSQQFDWNWQGKLILISAIRMFFFPIMALVIDSAGRLKSVDLKTGLGPKIWFTVCIAATAIFLVIQLSRNLMPKTAIALPLAGIIGYILLLFSKRIGFLIVLIAVLLNIEYDLTRTLSMPNSNIMIAVVPLIALINPLITWVVISRSWYQLSLPSCIKNSGTNHSDFRHYPAATAAPKTLRRSSVGYVICAFIVLLIELTLFVAAINEFVTRGFNPWAFLFGILISGVAGFSTVFFLIKHFTKKDHPKWIAILQPVYLGVIALTMLVGAAID